MNLILLITGIFFVSSASYARADTLSGHYERIKQECHDLSCIRTEMDRINNEILKLLTERTAYVKRAGDLKSKTTQIADDRQRVADQEQKIRVRSLELELPLEISLPAFRLIMENSIQFQQQYIDHLSTRTIPKKDQQMVKAVIFDCDGTLVDSEEIHFLAWQAAFQKQGYSLHKEFYIKHFSGVGDVEITKIATDALGISCSDELLTHKNAFFNDYQAVGISPVQPTVEFAKRLFEQKEKYGFKIAVASGARREEILRNLKNLNIEHYFDVILSGRDDLSEYQDPEGTNKPKSYVYLKAAKMLGLEPKECIAIEDSRTGVSSAIGSGCFTIAIPNSYTRQHDLSHAHMIIDSFAGLSVDGFFKMIGKEML